jgi:hypothetical protein
MKSMAGPLGFAVTQLGVVALTKARPAHLAAQVLSGYLARMK